MTKPSASLRRRYIYAVTHDTCKKLQGLLFVAIKTVMLFIVWSRADSIRSHYPSTTRESSLKLTFSAKGVTLQELTTHKQERARETNILSLRQLILFPTRKEVYIGANIYCQWTIIESFVKLESSISLSRL